MTQACCGFGFFFSSGNLRVWNAVINYNHSMLQIVPTAGDPANQILGSQIGHSVRVAARWLCRSSGDSNKLVRAAASGRPMVIKHCVIPSVKFKNIWPLVTIWEIQSFALRSRAVVCVSCQVVPGATRSSCCCVMSWHILPPCRRTSDFAQNPSLLNCLCREVGCLQGGRIWGAGECTCLLTRLWLTEKSWN